MQTLRKALIGLVAVLVISPAAARAQGASPGAGSGGPGGTMGGGVPTPLEFQGQGTPTNVITFSAGVSTLYDDNVLARNSLRLSDEALSVNSQIGISTTTQHVKLSFNYLPFFMFYRQNTEFNRLNHAANLALTFTLTPRVYLALHDVFSYQNGVYPTLDNNTLTVGSAVPPALNLYLYSPTARSLTNTPGVDLTLRKSARTSFTLSGNFTQQKFGAPAGAGTGQSLYNDTGEGGGFQYQYKVTPHTSFGMMLSYEDSTYQGGEIFGNRLRSQVSGAMVTLTSQLSPTLTLSLFGGPQYIRTLGQLTTGGSPGSQLEPSAGGSITDEVRKTALSMTVSRAVSSGGGIYASVVSTAATFAIRRRLVGRWEASWSGSADQADTSQLQLGNARTQSVTGGFTLERPIGRGSTFRVSYERIDQVSKTTLAIAPNFDRDQITVAIDYQLKAIPLGR